MSNINLEKIVTSDAQRNMLFKLFNKKNKSFEDEQFWTYIIAYLLLYGAKKKDIINKIILSNGNIDLEEVWFEAEPLSPIIGFEGNTKLDLSFGAIKSRGNTKTGIQFDSDAKDDYVCFVEAKFYSDLSTDTEFNRYRNQMIRIIDNLISFQAKDEKSPEKLIFTLLTPRCFLDKRKTKLYYYKFNDFKDSQEIVNDLNLTYEIEKYRLNKRYNISSQEIEKRIAKLTINWVTYEELLELECDLEKNKLDLLDYELNPNEKIDNLIKDISQKLFNAIKIIKE